MFHNSDDRVWAALQSAAEQAGLVQTDVSVLDKVQRSMKGYKGRSGAELVPFFDLVITYAAGRADKVRLNGTGEIALAAVHEHLTGLQGREPGQAQRQAGLDYLYSLAVGSVVAAGAPPTGLSYRAFETLLTTHLVRDGQTFNLPVR